jgi:hypothetical protein
MLRVLACDFPGCAATVFEEVVSSATAPGDSLQLLWVAFARDSAKSYRRRSRAWLYIMTDQK